MIDNLEWARAGWLFLLPLGIALGYLSYLMRTRAKLPLAPLQFGNSHRSAGFMLIALSLIEGLLACTMLVAIAGPQKSIRQKILKEPGADIALVLDISASMMADDFKPNRLDSLKKLTTEFLDSAGNNRYGVYVFGKHVFTQTPLTTDRGALKQMITHINYEMIDHYKSGGTAIGTAMLYVHDNLLANREEGRDQAIIVVTDGENSSGLDPKVAAKAVSAAGMRLYVIGMAGLEPVPLYVYGKKFINKNNKHVITSLDDESLKEMTAIAGGKYYRAIDEGVMRKILRDISNLEKTPLEVNNRISVISYAPYVGAVALLFAFPWLMLYGLSRRPLQ